MKTIRSLPELFQLMIDNKQLFEEECPNMGLCHFTYVLQGMANIISTSEAFILDDYIEKNRPRKTSKNHYAWPGGEWNPREKWLKQQIKKLTNEDY